MSACTFRESIDRHFAGAIQASEERALRGHLPGCTECLAYYRRHLVVARLDPIALGPEERLGRGLGFRPRPARLQMAAGFTVAALAIAAAVLLFVHVRRGRGDDGGFAARGAVHAPPPSHVLVYGAGIDAGMHLAGDSIRSNEELAFAYENGAAKAWLVVFGVDEHEHVYWFFPAWTSETESPLAIPVLSDGGHHMLPDAVRHRLDGARLDIHAIFLDAPLSVRDIERSLHDHPEGPLPIAGAMESSTSFVVHP